MEIGETFFWKNHGKLSHLRILAPKIFHVKDLGAVKQILGMRITRDKKNRKLTLPHNDYIQKVEI